MENNQNKESQQDDNKLNEFAKKAQQQNIKSMIKYSYELKKIGLVDSLRQNIASELTGDAELNSEIEKIASILNYYLGLFYKRDRVNGIKEKNSCQFHANCLEDCRYRPKNKEEKKQELEKHCKSFEEYLKTLVGDYQEYRNNILNINLLDTLEAKIKKGEVNVNKVRQIIKRYDENK